MKSFYTATAAAALVLSSGAALAQTSTNTNDQQRSTQQDRLNSIFGALFGDRTGSTDTIEAQWAAGRMPLGTQRAQFESRIDSDVRSGALDQRTGLRMKSDYAELVQLEARYGADRRFTTQERAYLADRYGRLTQALADGNYADTNADGTMTSTVMEGQTAFNQRVDASVTGRRVTRVVGTRLKNDYAALVRTEANYMRDGMISQQEQDDLDMRLDSLDARVGDSGYSSNTVAQTPRMRLDTLARALPSSGLTAAGQAQLRVEHEDLSRLEAAYARINATADDEAYLERRLTDIEMRARLRR